jgi:hypothetical protein
MLFRLSFFMHKDICHLPANNIEYNSIGEVMRILKIAQERSISNPPVFDFFEKVISNGRLTWRPEGDKWSRYESSESPSFNNFWKRAFLGSISRGGAIGSSISTYRLTISIFYGKDKYTYTSAIINLYYNIDMSASMSNMPLVASWKMDAENNLESDDIELDDWLKSISSQLGIKDIVLPHVVAEQKAKAMEGKVQKRVRLTRSKSIPRNRQATSFEIFVRPSQFTGHEVFYQITYLETGAKEPTKMIKDKADNGYPLQAEEALQILNKYVEYAKSNKYVDESSIEYIPQDANSSNFDFDTNERKGVVESQKPNEMEQEYRDLMGKSNKQYRVSQDFEGYFTGNVPDQVTQFLGSTAVDASQISSMFGKAHEAVNLVNQFDSSLLYNISFIFNFAKSGAYGVYLSALDRAIKTKALQKKLEQKGYEVKVTQQGLTAFPKQGNEIPPEVIQQDIDSIYSDLESKGGTAIGINMNAVLSAARQDALESGSKDPEIWQWIAVLHLGGTIAHEAIHARGSRSEGPSEQIEQSFTQWALPKINEEYKRSLESQGKGNEYTPLTITGRQRHAKSKSWYKTAQLSYYMPQSFTERAIGSDLGGRFPNGLHSEMGQAPWSMMAQQDQNVPVDRRLGKQYMSPIPRDLDQEHDSIEEQLRKYTRDGQKLDHHATMEELLSSGWDEDRGYITLEGLLDEKRPHPLMLPLKKNASNTMIKKATLFGWMNNLDISDGSTIPGLGDRVMAWDDRDEDFAADEEWIKQQPRYNPTYDIKGFYYRWIEPRFQPQTYDDMTRDYGNTHPAKRFASTKIDPEVTRILSVLSKAKSKIAKKDVASTRFILTEDVMPLIDRVFTDGSFKINVFHYGATDEEEDIFAVWISAPDVSEESIERAEKHLQNKSIGKDVDALIDELTGISKQRNGAVKEVIDIVKDVGSSFKISDLSIVGSYPRDIIMKVSPYTIDNMEFRGGWADQCIKIGGIVAERLGVQNIDMDHNRLSFVYKGISVSFSDDSIPLEISAGLKERGIDVSKNADLYNRDFTINMLSYNVLTDKISDPIGKASDDVKNKVLKTFFDPDYVCQQNPIVILRALKLKIRHNMEIDPLLQKAMIDNLGLIFDGRYSERDLIIARENVRKEGRIEAEELFKTFGLTDLETIK